MSNSWFRFKQFTVHQDRCAMKVTTDACLFGAWTAKEIQIRTDQENKHILDLGAGTGLLSLMIAQANPSYIIDGIDIDEECYEQAKENTEGTGWKGKINNLHGDAGSFVFGKKYDVIISNPPFYENELRSENEKKNIAHHSEHLSMVDLCRTIKNNLSDSGIFFLLLPYKRKAEIDELLKKENLPVSKRLLVRQTDHHTYFRMMIAGSLKASDLSMEYEIAIKDGNQQYTPEFRALLKDYYLNF